MSKPIITRREARPRKSKQLRVAAYARISEVKGNTPMSLSTQVSYYNERIQTNPAWVFAGVYADAGITGTSMKRPQFQKLLAEAEAGRIDLILTKSISRFARNTVDLLKTVRHLAELRVEVWFERENVKTLSGDGELMLSILASFAQEEAWSVSANVKWGIQKNFQKGITNQMCVYGYTWTGSEFLVNNQQAQAVQYIYKRFLEGARYCEIINECEELGYEAYWGGRFTTAALKMILRQERYTGTTVLGKSFNPYPGHHGMKNTGQAPKYLARGAQPMIIDQATWDKAQIALAERTLANQRCAPKHARTVFSGRVWCGPCERKTYRVQLYRDDKGEPVYGWSCRSKSNRKISRCNGGAIREDRIAQIVCLLTASTDYSDELFTEKVARIMLIDRGLADFHMSDGRVYRVHYWRGKAAKDSTWEDVSEQDGEVQA